MPSVQLGGVKQTLLITFYAKAMESRLPDSLLRDHFAYAALQRLDHDFSRFHFGRNSQVGIALRAWKLDRWAAEFLAAHPDACVLHLGCGLDSRVFRLDPPASVAWFDVDFPDVLALRRRVYPERAGCTLLEGDMGDPSWLAALPGGRPLLIVAEGLVPYLRESEVTGLLRALVARFPRGELIFDGYNHFGIRLLRLMLPLLARGAQAHWALDDPADLEALVPGLRLLDEHLVYTPEECRRMSWASRRFVDLMQRWPKLGRVGRLLRYRF
ncbi:class I SAM-dependent methyltransferase [Pseudomonas citronellolis]|uniref:class I SAM-dependent methyltransferase n=1 Tax=Pseudomonas citronellolis TaxID=53408 RepID=UPI0023E3D59E|nr:class I SAM-dependent methyltransferase [Pseudomonas citronellolis]MDF3931227.1 class I SAM-dependent methyltransferase [Pseudomonas citronellolis]